MTLNNEKHNHNEVLFQLRMKKHLASPKINLKHEVQTSNNVRLSQTLFVKAHCFELIQISYNCHLQLFTIPLGYISYYLLSIFQFLVSPKNTRLINEITFVNDNVIK